MYFFIWFKTIATLTIVDSNSFSRSVFRENFYNTDYFFNTDLFFTILPELVIFYFILYSLLTIFSKKKKIDYIIL